MRDDEVIAAADERDSPWCSPASGISGIEALDENEIEIRPCRDRAAARGGQRDGANRARAVGTLAEGRRRNANGSTATACCSGSAPSAVACAMRGTTASRPPT
jgi:hypothetical protein